jgi:hypothetical protein
MLKFLSRHGAKISQNEPWKASWKFGGAIFYNGCEVMMDKGSNSAEH